MCQSKLHKFIAQLPKCEHHMHLEGCLSPALVFELAAKNNVRLPDATENPSYASPNALAKRYTHFDCLEDFLQCHYLAMSVLVTSDDFEALAWEYFVNAHQDGVRHAEVFFDPQSHTSRGISFDTVVEGYSRACERARTGFGMSTNLILCFLRHLPLVSAKETLQQAIKSGVFTSDKIIGIGLDSSEIGFPPELFVECYREGQSRGIRRTAHGGEEGDTTYISGALDALGCQRIDHGIRLPESPELMARVAREKIMLTLCPLSNVALRCVKKNSLLSEESFLSSCNIPKMRFI